MASIEVVVEAARHSFENGSRMVVKPIAAMRWRPSSSGIVHSPCGAQFAVSIPNHETARIVAGSPVDVTMREPSVCSHPVGAAAAGAGTATSPARANAASAAFHRAARVRMPIIRVPLTRNC